MRLREFGEVVNEGGVFRVVDVHERHTIAFIDAQLRRRLTE